MYSILKVWALPSAINPYPVSPRLPYCSDNGIAITIRRVNPANPLRNVRIIMPGIGRCVSDN